MLRFKFLFVILLLFLGTVTSCNTEDEKGVTDKSGTIGENKTTDESAALAEKKESFLKIEIRGEEGAEDASFTSDASVAATGMGENFTLMISRGPNVGNGMDFMIYLQHKYSNISAASAPVPEGTYNLVADGELEKDDDNFSVSLVNLVSGTSFGYEVTDGTLNITESNENYVEGEFNFTTTSFTKGEKKVEVSGSFLANYNR
jgi:hypothetical protein